MKALRSLVKISVLLLLVFWPVSALAASNSVSTGDTGTACDPFTAVLGGSGATSSSGGFVLDPTVNNTVASGSIQTLCIPTASRDGDLVAVIDYSPANPITTDAFTNGLASRD